MFLNQRLQENSAYDQTKKAVDGVYKDVSFSSYFPIFQLKYYPKWFQTFAWKSITNLFFQASAKVEQAKEATNDTVKAATDKVNSAYEGTKGAFQRAGNAVTDTVSQTCIW